MRQVIYRECVPVGLFVKIIGGFVSLLTLCILLILITTGYVFQNPFWIVISTSVLAFLLLLFWNYKGIKIQLSTKGLLINYGILNRKSIPLEDIVSCEPTDRARMPLHSLQKRGEVAGDIATVVRKEIF